MIAGKLNEMGNKLGKLDEMVTFHQLQTMKADLIAQFESHMKLIEAKHLQLEKANLELRSRVESLEQKVKSFSSSPQPDNAHKRISFIGFEGMSALERIKYVSVWTSSNVAGVSCTTGNILRGPMNNRVLTKVSYVEFADSDSRNAVLSIIRSQTLACNCNSKPIAIKPALSAAIRSRIWALNKAEEMSRASQFAQGKQVVKTSDSNSRIVSVAGEIVFEQKVGGSDLGCFVGPLSSLSIPTSRSTA